MASKPPKTYTITIGRDSRSGEFIPVRNAKADPSHTEVERIKIPRKKGE